MELEAYGHSKISIHALREEGDPFNYEGKLRDFLISIHALREEGDFSLSGVTFVHFDFYPRPPRGGRRNSMLGAIQDNIFLSTPSARRATIRTAINAAKPVIFLSTPSARRATALETKGVVNASISIHALREEGDRTA